MARSSLLGLVLLAALAAGAGAWLRLAASGPTDGPEGFVLHGAPRDVPELRFIAGDRAAALSDFAGRTVLLNLWATWCAPCVAEMPTLDALQARLGGPGFEVVALSLDTTGTRGVRDFYARLGIEHLDLYVDPSAGASAALDAVGLPTTLLLDDEGREIGRLVGPAEWNSDAMVDFLASRAGASSPRASGRPAAP